MTIHNSRRLPVVVLSSVPHGKSFQNCVVPRTDLICYLIWPTHFFSSSTNDHFLKSLVADNISKMWRLLHLLMLFVCVCVCVKHLLILFIIQVDFECLYFDFFFFLLTSCYQKSRPEGHPLIDITNNSELAFWLPLLRGKFVLFVWLLFVLPVHVCPRLLCHAHHCGTWDDW